MKTFRTRARQSNFKYSGSVPIGTEISYGTDRANRVMVAQFHYHDP